MRHLCVLLIALAAAPAVAQIPTHPDEYAALIAACGRPLSQTQKPQAFSGPHAVFREVRYSKLEFFLLKNDTETWAVTGVFLRHGNDTLSREDAEAQMACLYNDRSVLSFRDDVTAASVTPAAVTPRPASSDGDGATEFAVVLVAMFLVFVGVIWSHARRWANRPKKLCLNCKQVRQPLQTKGKEWYCPVCQHKTPVPLDSPAALEYLGSR